MHEKHHEHPPVSAGKDGEAISEMTKLKKMAEHWIGHNEEHARSYRLWADRAREAGQTEPGEILAGIAGETLELNRKFERIILLLNESGRVD
jgi:hypothetical protein